MASSSQTREQIRYYRSRVRNQWQRNSSPTICIFKTSDNVPEHIGLGLFHHRDSMDDVQKMKERALMETVEAIGVMNRQELIQYVHDLLTDIKACYARSDEYFTDIPPLVQAEMFAMDACFILKFFTDCWIRNDKWLAMEMMADIFNLENQIPLFLLLKIMGLQFNNSTEAAASEFAARLGSYLPFQTLVPFEIRPADGIASYLTNALLKTEERDKCHHLLQLLVKSIHCSLSSTQHFSTVGLTAPVLPLYDKYHYHLEYLHDYKINFKASKKEVRFEKRRFQSNILHLPQIKLDEATEPLLKNLMHFADIVRRDKLICDLMYLMNCIVKKTNECLFREVGIIQGQSAFSITFSERIHTLCRDVTKDAGQYQQLINELDEHCKFPPNRWICQVSDFFCRYASLALIVTILLGIIGWFIK